MKQRSSRIIWNIYFFRRRRKQRTEKEWSKRKRQYYFRDTFLEIHLLTFCNLRFYPHNFYDFFHIKQDIYSLLCCFFLQVSPPHLFIISLSFYSLRLLLMDIYACFVMKSDVFDFIISNHFEYSYWRFSVILKCRFISVLGFAVFRRILQEF